MFQGLANGEQEDGILAFRVRRKKANHVIIEEGQPCWKMRDGQSEEGEGPTLETDEAQATPPQTAIDPVE